MTSFPNLSQLCKKCNHELLSHKSNPDKDFDYCREKNCQCTNFEKK